MKNSLCAHLTQCKLSVSYLKLSLYGCLDLHLNIFYLKLSLMQNQAVTMNTGERFQPQPPPISSLQWFSPLSLVSNNNATQPSDTERRTFVVLKGQRELRERVVIPTGTFSQVPKPNTIELKLYSMFFLLIASQKTSSVLKRLLLDRKSF